MSYVSNCKYLMFSIGQMGGAPSQSACPGRDRSSKSNQNWKETEKSLEENGHQGLLCWWRFYSKTSKVWTFHQTNGKIRARLKICKFQVWNQVCFITLIFLFIFKGLRFKKAHVTHPELKATFCLPILGVKKNPSSPLYTSLGVITKGTVVEVNVSELGLVTQGGKVIWGEWSQICVSVFGGCTLMCLYVSNKSSFHFQVNRLTTT